MACMEKFKGPINSINQVIYVINQLIDRICDTFGGILSGEPNSLLGYDGSGNLDNVLIGEGLTLISSTLSANDFHSGAYFVASGETATILINRQSINKGGLDIEGDLVVEGQLFMEV